MSDTAVVTPPASAPGNVKDTPEFQEALKQERERMRLDFDKEYQRKQQDLENRMTPPAAQPMQANANDFFTEWGERHGLSADAGRELVQGTLAYIQGTVIPEAIKPLSQSAKRQELRSQRAEIRSKNTKLTKLDDRFHAEVMKLLDPLDPKLIGPDSYARALHMVIGQNIEQLEEEQGRAAKEAGSREAEPAPGPEPLPSSGPAKGSGIVLNAKQQQFCTEKDFAKEEFVEMMRERARKMEAQGIAKPEVRRRLGDLLGAIEF